MSWSDWREEVCQQDDDDPPPRFCCPVARCGYAGKTPESLSQHTKAKHANPKKEGTSDAE